MSKDQKATTAGCLVIIVIIAVSIGIGFLIGPGWGFLSFSLFASLMVAKLFNVGEYEELKFELYIDRNGILYDEDGIDRERVVSLFSISVDQLAKYIYSELEDMNHHSEIYTYEKLIENSIESVGVNKTKDLLVKMINDGLA
jgi:hypothetical protein